MNRKSSVSVGELTLDWENIYEFSENLYSSLYVQKMSFDFSASREFTNGTVMSYWNETFNLKSGISYS